MAPGSTDRGRPAPLRGKFIMAPIPFTGRGQSLKVYMRSYKIQTVLIVMGSIMCIASSVESTVRNQDQMWFLGLTCLFIGVASWLLIQLEKMIKAREFRRRREALRAQKTQPAAQTTVRTPVRRGL